MLLLPPNPNLHLSLWPEEYVSTTRVIYLLESCKVQPNAMFPVNFCIPYHTYSIEMQVLAVCKAHCLAGPIRSTLTNSEEEFHPCLSAPITPATRGLDQSPLCLNHSRYLKQLLFF